MKRDVCFETNRGGEVGILLVLSCLILGMVGCGQEESIAEEPLIIYLCTESRQTVLAPAQPTPAVHPETGKATLLYALYCSQCGRWQAVPPPDQYAGSPSAYRCPIHRSSMSPDGPR